MPPTGRIPPSGTTMVWSLTRRRDGRAIDGHRGQRHPAESRRDRVELDPVDRRRPRCCGWSPSSRRRSCACPRQPQVGVVRRVEQRTRPADRARHDVAGHEGRRRGRHRPASTRGDRGLVALELRATDRRHPRSRPSGRDDGEQPDEQESEASCHRTHRTPRRPRRRLAGMLRRVTTSDSTHDGSHDRRTTSSPRSQPACRGSRLLTEPIDRESYRPDETPYLHAGLPRAVALPTTTAEVAELVRIAARAPRPDRAARRRHRPVRRRRRASRAA